jgi:hypothetical protein
MLVTLTGEATALGQAPPADARMIQTSSMPGDARLGMFRVKDTASYWSFKFACPGPTAGGGTRAKIGQCMDGLLALVAQSLEARG